MQRRELRLGLLEPLLTERERRHPAEDRLIDVPAGGVEHGDGGIERLSVASVGHRQRHAVGFGNRQLQRLRAAFGDDHVAHVVAVVVLVGSHGVGAGRDRVDREVAAAVGRGGAGGDHPSEAAVFALQLDASAVDRIAASRVGDVAGNPRRLDVDVERR